ncbi:Hypothetical predicted protein [Podarcis lilfordi]|uniref:Uncharacterized protein n=1 Tax=Podarcis lilfordi TaxID=74358 RepID=A0AA35PMH5_9SAUR|nr:Hypothetical predicted protein [Podarcis lilfordi]
MTLWEELRAVRRDEGDPAEAARGRGTVGGQPRRRSGEGAKDGQPKGPPTQARGGRERHASPPPSLQPDPASQPATPPPSLLTSPLRPISCGGAATIAEGTSLAANQRQGLAGPLAASLDGGEKVG